jgi:heme-degrading monooxygenase HmoA
MHAVVRHYRTNAELADELAKRSGEVEELIRGVDGFVAYYLVKTSDGTASISVFEDQAGTQESTRRAAAFVKENLASVAGEPPEVIEGETVIHFAR